MLEKNANFYMANFYPEIGRIFRAYDAGQNEVAEQAKSRAMKIADTILAFPDLKSSAREEWFVARSLTDSYAKLDTFSRQVLEKFAEPFSTRFMSNYGK